MMARPQENDWKMIARIRKELEEPMANGGGTMDKDLTENVFIKDARSLANSALVSAEIGIKKMARPNDYLDDVQMLIQLAEEAAELSSAAAKAARHFSRQNPTRKTDAEIEAAIEEELGDVLLVSFLTDYRPDWDAMYNKYKRWMERLRGGEGNGFQEGNI